MAFQRETMRRATPLLVLLALMVQACGGGGSGDEPSNNSASSPVSPAPPPSTAPPPPAAAPAPAPAPAAAPAPAPVGPDITCGLANFEADALRIVNAYRSAGATCGSRGSFAPAGALTLNSRLTSAAYGHSADMAANNYFSHTSLDGRSMVDRINATGYDWSTVGENIAAGYGTMQQVVDGWMASDGHCANLMNPRFTEMGLACARNANSTYRIYWTQNLGRP
jgi:uncharacterized protein YkwD